MVNGGYRVELSKANGLSNAEKATYNINDLKARISNYMAPHHMLLHTLNDSSGHQFDFALNNYATKFSDVATGDETGDPEIDLVS